MKFSDMHEITRHAIHVSEVLQVSIETVAAIRKYQQAIHGRRLGGSLIDQTCRQQADEYLGFQLQVLKSLKLRSESTDRRLVNEVGFVSHPLPALHIQCFSVHA